MDKKEYDLRSAIDICREMGELRETDVTVDPDAELAGIYRYIGAGGTCVRPTKEGPAVIFNNIKDMPGAKVLIGLLASRRRVAKILGEKPERLGFLLADAVNHPIDPVFVGPEEALCQEEVHLATDPDFDIRKILPAPTNTPEDAGPYITMGMCYATDKLTGKSDVTIHRLCLQGKDEISMYFVPAPRHLDVYRERYEAEGKPMPISISIGVDPAIEIASCFEAPTTPIGFNELSIAGALRGEGVKLAPCLTINERCIANAEYVIEGELLPGVRVREDINTNTGKAMPEFPGYIGEANPSLPVVKVKAITTRHNPIMQTCIGSSEEHVSMAGIPTEASILTMVERAMPGKVKNVYCASCGGGKYVAVLQFCKKTASDEGRQRQAALLAFAAFSELKHVFVVDDDVDCFDISDVMWAMTTRFQADVDLIPIPGVRHHPLDPSDDPTISPSIRDHGIACKAIFDCTVPFNQKHRFRRCPFKEVDYKKWFPDL